MKKQNITVKVVPDKRRIKDTKRFPLKLRITYRGCGLIMALVTMLRKKNGKLLIVLMPKDL